MIAERERAKDVLAGHVALDHLVPDVIVAGLDGHSHGMQSGGLEQFNMIFGQYVAAREDEERDSGLLIGGPEGRMSAMCRKIG